MPERAVPSQRERQIPVVLPPFEQIRRLRAALMEIATRPTVERNPDGVDQAAHTMQLIARDALGMEGS